MEALTDNKNRTASNVKNAFTKGNGNVGTPGCVSFMFDKKGVIACNRDGGLSEDEIYEMAIECGADDVQVEDDMFEVLTSPADFSVVRKCLEDKGVTFINAEVEWVPQNTVKLSAEQLEKFERMLDMFDDNDDVQNVYHNVELPDEE